MRTLVESMDSLASGQLAKCGDLLMQRYKAVETSVHEGGSWEVASNMEVILPSMPSATGEAERAAAVTSRSKKQRAARLAMARLAGPAVVP